MDEQQNEQSQNAQQNGNNEERVAWDIGSLSQKATVMRATQQVADMLSIFHNRLVERGFDQDEAMDLTHQFLATYVTSMFDAQAARGNQKQS